MRKARGLFPPTPFRARRAVSVTSVVANPCKRSWSASGHWGAVSTSLPLLKRKSALDRHATVHWMDTTASIQLKFMRPLDGQTRYNLIETCVSMGWTQSPPLPTRGIYRPASRRLHPHLSRTRKLYQNRRAAVKSKTCILRDNGFYVLYVGRQSLKARKRRVVLKSRRTAAPLPSAALPPMRQSVLCASASS